MMLSFVQWISSLCGWLHREDNFSKNCAILRLSACITKSVNIAVVRTLAYYIFLCCGAGHCDTQYCTMSDRQAAFSYDYIQKSLQSLLETLDRSHPYFVRCIKSNMEKTPGRLDDELVRRQLRYTGMLATVKLRQSGYNYRVLFPVSSHSQLNIGIASSDWVVVSGWFR